MEDMENNREKNAEWDKDGNIMNKDEWYKNIQNNKKDNSKWDKDSIIMNIEQRQVWMYDDSSLIRIWRMTRR